MNDMLQFLKGGALKYWKILKKKIHQTKNVPNNEIWGGNPAKYINKVISE